MFTFPKGSNVAVAVGWSLYGGYARRVRVIHSFIEYGFEFCVLVDIQTRKVLGVIEADCLIPIIL